MGIVCIFSEIPDHYAQPEICMYSNWERLCHRSLESLETREVMCQSTRLFSLKNVDGEYNWNYHTVDDYQIRTIWVEWQVFVRMISDIYKAESTKAEQKRSKFKYGDVKASTVSQIDKGLICILEE